MRFVYDGGSFAAGILTAAVYLGALSPWWLLLLPVCFIRFEALTVWFRRKFR